MLRFVLALIQKIKLLLIAKQTRYFYIPIFVWFVFSV